MPTLGIERTKTGPGSKTRALIIPECACFQILAMITVFFVFLIVYVHQAKVAVWARKHQLMDEKLKAEYFAHEATTTMMTLTVDLEAHIAREIEWNHLEQQMVERQGELRDASRISINEIVYVSMQMIGNSLREEMTGMDISDEKEQNVRDLFAKHQKTMDAKMNAAFDEYMKQTQELNKAYLSVIQSESEENKHGLKQAHAVITQFAIKAGVAKNDDMPQEALDDKVKNFFVNVEAKAKEAKDLKLPPKVLKKLGVLIHDFQSLSPEEVVKRMNKLFFPGGANEGASKYGVAHYEGGSLEAYLENVRFLNSFNTELYPALKEKKARWKSRELSPYELLDEILRMVEGSVLPATWLLYY